MPKRDEKKKYHAANPATLGNKLGPQGEGRGSCMEPKGRAPVPLGRPHFAPYPLMAHRFFRSSIVRYCVSALAAPDRQYPAAEHGVSVSPKEPPMRQHTRLQL